MQSYLWTLRSASGVRNCNDVSETSATHLFGEGKDQDGQSGFGPVRSTAAIDSCTILSCNVLLPCRRVTFYCVFFFNAVCGQFTRTLIYSWQYTTVSVRTVQWSSSIITPVSVNIF